MARCREYLNEIERRHGRAVQDAAITDSAMTSKQFRAALDRLGLTQARAAEIFGADARTARRWALDEAPVPQPVAVILKLLLAGKISIADIEGR